MSAGHYHLHVHAISKGKGHDIFAALAYRHGTGNTAIPTATAAAAYRHAQELGNGERVFDYRGKIGVQWTGLIAPDNAPDWARNPLTLWNVVDRTETRSNARFAQEVVIALPHQVGLADHIELLQRFARAHTLPRRMVADIAIHAPPVHAGGDPRNWHAHVLLTDRPIGPAGFDRTKDRRFTDREMVQEFREGWTRIHNELMAELGLPYRIDHRRLDQQRAEALERGDDRQAILLDRLPQMHLGKAVHAGHPRFATYTDRRQRNQAILAANTARHEHHQRDNEIEHLIAARAALDEDARIRHAVERFDLDSPSLKELERNYGRPPPTTQLQRLAQAVRDDTATRRALALARRHGHPWNGGNTRPDAPLLGDILTSMVKPTDDKPRAFTVTARDFAFICYRLGFSSLRQLHRHLADITHEEQRRRAERANRTPPPRAPFRLRELAIPRPQRDRTNQLEVRLGHIRAAVEMHHSREQAFQARYIERIWARSPPGGRLDGDLMQRSRTRERRRSPDQA